MRSLNFFGWLALTAATTPFCAAIAYVLLGGFYFISGLGLAIITQGYTPPAPQEIPVTCCAVCLTVGVLFSASLWSDRFRNVFL